MFNRYKTNYCATNFSVGRTLQIITIKCIKRSDPTPLFSPLHLNCALKNVCIELFYVKLSCQNALICDLNALSDHINCLKTSSKSGHGLFESLNLVVLFERSSTT